MGGNRDDEIATRATLTRLCSLKYRSLKGDLISMRSNSAFIQNREYKYRGSLLFFNTKSSHESDSNRSGIFALRSLTAPQPTNSQ